MRFGLFVSNQYRAAENIQPAIEPRNCRQVDASTRRQMGIVEVNGLADKARCRRANRPRQKPLAIDALGFVEADKLDSCIHIDGFGPHEDLKHLDWIVPEHRFFMRETCPGVHHHQTIG
jgi:hypothetical protein